VIAIDGKTSRRSYQKKGAKAPIHMVSAFAARQRLVLSLPPDLIRGPGQGSGKIQRDRCHPQAAGHAGNRGGDRDPRPSLGQAIDAMGCQREIVQKIVDKKADYVLALKGAQGSLREDVEIFVAEQKAKDFKDTKISRDETIDADHGRIETRTTTVIHDVAWLQGRHNWPGLKAVLVVESTWETGDKIERETRFDITSLVLLAILLGPIVRSHWAIENSLHWVMDMIFRDDECRVRTDHAPANFTTVKHMAHNLIRKAPGKDSLRPSRKVAAWDDDFLASLVAA
jgi:predicted transposase YbfD/YdcC